MDAVEFLNRYTDEVYLAGDADAARRFIADPCLRHEHGELVTMSLDDNVARIQAFLDSFPELSVANRLAVSEGENIVSCYELASGDRVISGIEVFRIQDGLITETWNSAPQSGRWG